MMKELYAMVRFPDAKELWDREGFDGNSYATADRQTYFVRKEWMESQGLLTAAVDVDKMVETFATTWDEVAGKDGGEASWRMRKATLDIYRTAVEDTLEEIRNM